MLTVPEQFRDSPPKLHGEHLAYHGRVGYTIAGVGKTGVWVRFDGEKSYVGCPLEWLTKVS